MEKNTDTKNSYGSQVENGFKCKPTIKDPNRPLMGYRYHLFICDGGRCKTTDLADKLRSITKELDINRGENRVKITRSFCFGACRFASVSVLYGYDRAIWIKNIEEIANWKEFFLALIDGDISSIQDRLIEIK
jgi:(2Fe-2S) ferredoxin